MRGVGSAAPEAATEVPSLRARGTWHGGWPCRRNICCVRAGGGLMGVPSGFATPVSPLGRPGRAQAVGHGGCRGRVLPIRSPAMPSRRHPSPGLRAAELALAVPQVVSHRVARMAAAGPWPGARDRREFHRMGSEKVAAFHESWTAMWWQAWRAQMQFATAWMQWWSWPARIAEHGLKPVHRRAVANARRLAAPRRHRRRRAA